MMLTRSVWISFIYDSKSDLDDNRNLTKRSIWTSIRDTSHAILYEVFLCSENASRLDEEDNMILNQNKRPVFPDTE